MNNDSCTDLPNFEIHPFKLKRLALPFLESALRGVAPYLWNRRERSRTKIQSTFPVPDFSMELSDNAVLHDQLDRTANILKELTNSSKVTVYVVDTPRHVLYLSHSDAGCSGERLEWKIEPGQNVAAYVASVMDSVLVNAEDLHLDTRFPEGIGWDVGISVNSLICVPIVIQNRECSAVIEIYRDDGIQFVEKDVGSATIASGWIGSALEQHQFRKIIKQQMDIRAKLSAITEKVTSNDEKFENAFAQIVSNAETALGGQLGTFYMLLQETKQLVVYEEVTSAGKPALVPKNLRSKIKGIVGAAIESGQIVNVPDVQKDPRFDKEIDQKCGRVTHSVICLPIMGECGCFGAIELINKLPQGHFNDRDQELLKIFGPYCGIIINYQKTNEGRIKAEMFSEIYSDIVTFRITERIKKEVTNVTSMEAMDIEPEILNFSWYPAPNYFDKMTSLTFWMFTDLFGRDYVDPEVLLTFIITVKKYHRKLDYHNFEHAFASLHMVYNILKRGDDRFDLIEKLSLVIGTICHDIDHHGYSNGYIRLSKDPLCAIYDDSYLENHHVWFGKILLKNTNILSQLSQQENDQFLEYFTENILATDVTVHLLEHRVQLERICSDDNNIDWNKEKHRALVRGLVMMSADLCVCVKPFRIAERITGNLLKEYFHQGDNERLLRFEPVPYMNRSLSKHIPHFQVGFLKTVSLPCFDLLRKILPSTQELHTNCTILMNSWTEIIESAGLKTWNPERSIGLCREMEDD